MSSCNDYNPLQFDGDDVKMGGIEKNNPTIDFGTMSRTSSSIESAEEALRFDGSKIWEGMKIIREPKKVDFILGNANRKRIVHTV